jgi:hypothetical protein
MSPHGVSRGMKVRYSDSNAAPTPEMYIFMCGYVSELTSLHVCEYP